MKIARKFSYFTASASDSDLRALTNKRKVQVARKFSGVSCFTAIETIFMLMPKKNPKTIPDSSIYRFQDEMHFRCVTKSLVQRLFITSTSSIGLIKLSSKKISV